jgi:dTDP-4-dehydrorhamnose reductase
VWDFTPLKAQWSNTMRILFAGWHGQIAKAFMEHAPSCADISACAAGRPALDLCEPRSVKRAFADISPDIVINAAAFTAVDEAEDNPDRAFALNRDGARMLAEEAARRGAPVIHISTDYVFDGVKQGPYTEGDAPNPQTVYGRSKLEGEAAVQEANPRSVILRTAWVYSPFGRNFVSVMLTKAREIALARERDGAQAGEKLGGGNDQFGSPTYAPHLVEAILGVARRLAAGGDCDKLWGVYHAAGSEGAMGGAGMGGGGDVSAVSWRDLAEEVFRQSAALGGPAADVEAITSKDYPTRALRPLSAQLDCSKLYSVFGLRLPPWREGVVDCVRRLLEA